MNAEIEEYFYLLREVCRADDSSLGTATVNCGNCLSIYAVRK